MSFPFVQPYFGLGNSLQTAQGAAGGGAVGGWVELARTTLGSAGDDITVSSLADKRYYMVLTNILNSGYIDGGWRFNGDTGSNYSVRRSYNGGTDNTSVNQTYAAEGAGDPCPNLWVSYIANKSDKEKLAISHQVMQNNAGAGSAPIRMEHNAKWSNTSDVINSITQHNTQAGSFDTNSEVVVLGWDPADTHTTNFWEELASVDLSGGAAGSIDSGTILAKKYLWFQAYVDGSTVSNLMHIRMNGLSTGIYADRYNLNGGTDGTDTSSGSARISNLSDQLPKFVNGFIVNNSANEKLGIVHEVSQSTAGAANAPQRTESVFKIANTSAQITSLQLINLSGNWGTGSYFKVWGSN